MISKPQKRIYAIVASTVDGAAGKVAQAPGRMAAQAVHAASRMKMHRLLDARARGVSAKRLRRIANEATTTIILACRDSQELRHVALLLRKARIKHYAFEDTNPGVYGAGEYETALATVPVFKDKISGILDYLPLFLGA